MSPAAIALVSIISAVVAAVAAYVGHLLTRRSTRESNITADWTAFAEAQKIATANLEATVQRQGSEITNQGERINRLDRMLRDEQKRFRLAISFIRELLRWIEHHVPGQQPPEVPESLKEEV
ncbi:hypothetical protein D4768_09630 [Rhodococcus erythropolis]|uniref:hypothetical protein n=1 Tax=Rhodococcus erythropolis TaxID=1833 RepID=UPI001F43F522|nr:hypothetical protein [Rhodococcus erythropolis]UJC77928.1 hypothetical protein D4768_09630 [Rhodococcus erythropolis]